MDTEHLDHVLERLSVAGPVRSRRMFGGAGLYLGELFFGLVAHDRLYLRADPARAAELERAGSEPFQPFADRPSMRTYWSVPERVLADRAELRRWIERALACARAAARRPSSGSSARRSRRK